MSSLNEIRARGIIRNQENAQFDDENGKLSTTKTNPYDGDKRKSTTTAPSFLQCRHWIVAILYVTSIYYVCSVVDSKLPEPLSDAEAGANRFSEERARRHLNAFAAMGPRVAGSEANEIHARNYILQEVETIRRSMDEGEYRLDVDVHKPNGCFGLAFLSKFTLCYKNVTNIAVRLGRRRNSSGHSLLLNCHFDSVPQSPGATDDAISCAIMLELMNIFSRQHPDNVPHDLIFLFNGAEENFLQASHGFITTHPWRHTIRTFINLEGCGAGGREMLFQSGPGNIWLMHAYLDNAPHPHCSIMAQEIFQSGTIPGETDYRIFRDFGRIPGMDIAYTKNGYVYHTEFDRPEYVEPGALQRGGENIYGAAAGIIRSPCFTRPCPQQETKLVYFDVVGQFVIQYPLAYGTLLNYAFVILVLVRIFRQIQRSKNRNDRINDDDNDDSYTLGDVIRASVLHLVSVIVISAVTYAMILTTNFLDLTLCWHNRRCMVLVLYVLPPLIAGLGVHYLVLLRNLGSKGVLDHGFRRERVAFDTAMALFAIAVFVLTWLGLGSAYYALLHASFPLLRDVFTKIYEKLVGRKKSAPILFVAHSMALFPVIALSSYGMISTLEIFIPIMGRSGPVFNPEILIGILGSTCSLVTVFYMGGMVYLSRGFGEILKFVTCIVALVVAIAAFTDFGAPYVFDTKAPRLRRAHIQHVSRTIYEEGSDRINTTENALLLAGLDYRGARDLPSTAFLQGSSTPPCIREDAYCALPYYISVKDMFPPERLLWMPVTSSPTFEKPIGIELKSETENRSDGTVTLDFSLKGYDHMTVFITPLNDWTLEKWSLTDEILGRGNTQTYFLYLAYVGEENGPWEISLTFKKPAKDAKPNASKLLLGVASHYLHGPHRQTPQAKSLVDNILERRQKPPTDLGAWKWAMTTDVYASEYIAKYY